MTCPTCRGAKVLVGFGCPGFKRVELPCYDCKGTGAIDDVRVIWKRDGEMLRKTRMARDMSLREAAAWVGVTPVEWNDAEHAKVDPSPLRAKVRLKIDESLASIRQRAAARSGPPATPPVPRDEREGGHVS